MSELIPKFIQLLEEWDILGPKYVATENDLKVARERERRDIPTRSDTLRARRKKQGQNK